VFVWPVLVGDFCGDSYGGVNVGPKPVITEPIDESRLVTLTGNTTAAVFEASNDRGPVADSLTFDHLLLTLKLRRKPKRVSRD